MRIEPYRFGLPNVADRTSALGVIAGRPELSPAAQVHLVDTIFDREKDDDRREKLLIDLIDNPEFSDEARAELLLNLRRVNSRPVREDLIHVLYWRLHPERVVVSASRLRRGD